MVIIMMSCTLTYDVILIAPSMVILMFLILVIVVWLSTVILTFLSTVALTIILALLPMVILVVSSCCCYTRTRTSATPDIHQVASGRLARRNRHMLPISPRSSSEAQAAPP